MRATSSYDAVAIGNFSRNQGSLFRSPGSPYPRLDTCEDTLDQLEFQLSKWEVFGPFSVTPSTQGKTSLIVAFPTKFFHYSGGRRINKINNPFKAQTEGQGETLKTSLSQGDAPLPADSQITLPYSVNVIGLYQNSDTHPRGIDNLGLSVFSYDSGDAKLTSDNTAQRILIQDYEYLRELFTSYRGLPSLGLILQEYVDPDVLYTSIIPAEFSAVWGASSIESILFPTFISGPSSGKVGDVDTYTTGGSCLRPSGIRFSTISTGAMGPTRAGWPPGSRAPKRHGIQEGPLPFIQRREVLLTRVLNRNGQMDLA